MSSSAVSLTSKERDMTERSMDRMDQAPEEARQQWLGMLQTLSEQIQRQQQTSQHMTQEMMETYMQLLNTPGSYLSGQAEQQQQNLQQTAQQWMQQAQQQQQTFQEQAQQQQQAFQQMTQEVMSTYAQLFNSPISVWDEPSRETDMSQRPTLRDRYEIDVAW